MAAVGSRCRQCEALRGIGPCDACRARRISARAAARFDVVHRARAREELRELREQRERHRLAQECERRAPRALTPDGLRLADEAARYLAAVDAFRVEGHGPDWSA